MTDQPQPLILASSSPFRRELLGKLRLSFQHHSPDIDERARPGETPTELVLRLARDKAAALADAHPDALIIGSDQVAVIDGDVLGKPAITTPPWPSCAAPAAAPCSSSPGCAC